MKTKKKKKRAPTAAKAAAKAKAAAVAPVENSPEGSEQVAMSPRESEQKNTPMKDNKRCPKNPEATPEAAVVPSPVPPGPKRHRHRGKQADPDSEAQVQSLKEALRFVGCVGLKVLSIESKKTKHF